jgi:hypothetical protein
VASAPEPIEVFAAWKRADRTARGLAYQQDLALAKRAATAAKLARLTRRWKEKEHAMIDPIVREEQRRLTDLLEGLGFTKAAAVAEADAPTRYLVGKGVVRIGGFFALPIQIVDGKGRTEIVLKTPFRQGVGLTAAGLLAFGQAALQLGKAVDLFNHGAIPPADASGRHSPRSIREPGVCPCGASRYAEENEEWVCLDCGRRSPFYSPAIGGGE